MSHRKNLYKYMNVLCFSHINMNLITVLLLQIVGIIFSWIILLKVFCILFDLFNLVSFASETCFLFQVTNERNSLLNKVPYLFKSRLIHFIGSPSVGAKYCCHGRKVARQSLSQAGQRQHKESLQAGQAASPSYVATTGWAIPLAAPNFWRRKTCGRN